jgi:hypothetical protein
VGFFSSVSSRCEKYIGICRRSEEILAQNQARYLITTSLCPGKRLVVFHLYKVSKSQTEVEGELCSQHCALSAQLERISSSQGGIDLVKTIQGHCGGDSGGKLLYRHILHIRCLLPPSSF